MVWNKGLTKETDSRIKKRSEKLLGHSVSIDTRKKMSLAKKGKVSPRKGIKLSEETRKKISMVQIGKKISEETRQRMSLAQKKINNIPPSHKGKIRSTETRKKISIARTGMKGHPGKRGVESHFWLGGLHKNPYSIDWTETFRRSIRERDHYTCQICSKIQAERAFAVHHKDYNKENNNPNNLITLCTECHVKTNFNRKKWLDHFKVGWFDD